jgi:hypothetical protein
MLENLGIVVRLPAEARNLSLLYCAETGSEAHPASYAIGTNKNKQIP